MKEYSWKYYADRSAMKLLQIVILILSSILTALCLLCYLRFELLVFLILMILFLSTGALLTLFFLPLYFKNLYYHITPEQIAIHKGIFFRREQSIRLQSVQFVQIITGYHDGISGLNFMILYVYGGSLLLSFMNRDDRRELTEFLERKGIFHAP
ncbi:MAG: PH domain-containing protein [Oscillospiraceae bacterium]|nr:PH domain-containing protein [Oscillospiraceae bacterium]